MKPTNANLNFLCQIINRIRKSNGRTELNQIGSSQKLQRDLELDSLDLAEMTVLIESEFGVDVFDDGIASTVQDVLDRIQNV